MMLRDLFSLIFPQNCINCQESLNYEEIFLCTPCKIDLPFTNDHQHHENELFQKFVFEPKVESATAFLYFHKKSISQKLLYQLKYNDKKELGIILGKWFAPCLKNLEADFIIPVPLHKSKQRKRSYNQSELIAYGICELLKIPVRSDLIKRIVATKTQTKKTKLERWQNVENIYSNVSEDLTDKSIIIVDDVITTGATVGMLADRLIEANVEHIHIASIARGE